MAFGRRPPEHGRSVWDLHGLPHFCSPLAAKPRQGLEALDEKHEGELVELQGRWKRGRGEVPDALFDPQFVCNEEDFTFCKGFGKSGDSYQRSKLAAVRAAKRMAEGKGKGKDKAKGKDKGKEQPAVGGTGQPAAGGGGGKGKPAVGGKGQLVLARGLPFESNILFWDEDGTWYYRTGKCVSLPHLFAKCGPLFTAAQLYKYYNLCRPIASKRPHAWCSPARQEAAFERYAATGRYGHGSEPLAVAALAVGN